MSTYEDNRARQKRLRGLNQDSAINDRVGSFLRAITSPFALPFTYGPGMIDAAIKAQKRGSRIPGSPELGLSEAIGSFANQFTDDVKTAVTGRQTPGDIASSPITPQASRQFDNTLAGQYQRYFKTPEFDNVFGAGARGEKAPQDAAAMEALGNQIMAPKKDTNIASMYAAQSAMGRVNQDAIQKMYEGNKEMQEWAKANPMLAQREYMKAEAKRVANMPDNTQYDTGTAVRGETPGSLEQQLQYGAGSPISKSPTEYDISNSNEEEFKEVFNKLFGLSKN